METIFIEEVHVEREARQRWAVDEIDSLKRSIDRRGLLNPIVVDEDNVLIAGERRLTACRALGHMTILARRLSDLSPLEKQAVELEENIARKNLSWQEHNKAIFDFHALCLQLDPSWTAGQTAEELHVDTSTVTRHLQVRSAVEAGSTNLLDVAAFTTALNIVQRVAERVVQGSQELGLDIPAIGEGEPATKQETGARDNDAGLGDVDLDLASVALVDAIADVPRSKIIAVNGNFIGFALEGYKEHPKFNLIHCDFPYGIGQGDRISPTSQSKSVSVHGAYNDTPSVYRRLLDSLLANQENLVAEDAHIICWCHMDRYIETVNKLAEHGWRVWPYPLIWVHASSKGLLPDPARSYRQIYQTAVFAHRGERKVIQAANNCTEAVMTKDHHSAEKPLAVLRHFFKPLVDSSTAFLDPTFGSGNSLIVAEELGAYHICGVEMDKAFHTALMERTNCG